MSLINKLFGKNDKQSTSSPARESAALRQTDGDKVDVNKPVENPRLKALFEQWRQQQTDDLLNKVFEEIVLRSHFLSVMMLSEEPEQNHDDTATIRQGTIMQFPMLTTHDGKHFYPAFTDWNELSKWQNIGSPPKTLIMAFDDYAAMALSKEGVDGIVINPFGDNFLLDNPLLNQLKTRKDLNTKGASRQVVKEDTQVMLGDAKEYPTAMVAAISDYLTKQPSARRAWLRLMIQDNEQSYLLIAEFAGNNDAFFGGISDAARPYLNGMNINMVPYQDSFGKSATKNVPPFYESK